MIDLHAYKGRQAAIAASPDAQSRHDLVIKYMPLVHYVVNNLALSLPPMLDTDDILSYGTMGLIDAIDRFDASRCVKFETYAVTRVRGYIIDQLRALDWIPRSARQRARQIEKAHDELQRETGQAPSAEQVAQHLGLDRGKYQQALQDASCVTLSLDAMLHPDEENLSGGLLQVIHDDASPSPTAYLETRDLQDTVSSALSTLPEREQHLLRLYYFEERTLQEISQVLAVSESRVCQLHTRALGRLRTVMAAAA